MSKLKDYIHGTIITQGYSLEYVNFEEHHLDKLIELAQEAKINIRNNNMYYKLEGLYEDFHNVMKSGHIMDTTKEAVFNAIYRQVVEVTGLEYRFDDADADIFLEEFGRYLTELQDAQ